MVTKLLGGSQVQLSPAGKLATAAKLGEIGHGAPAPVTHLDTDPGMLGTPADAKPLSDAAVVKTPAPVSTPVAGNVEAGGDGGGAGGGTGDGPGDGDGGDGGE